MKPIKVPNVPASAYDRNRPASDLLKRQVDQLQHVLSAVASTGNRVTDMKAAAKRVKTEGQASAFMLKAMLALHPEGSTRPLARPLAGAPAKRTTAAKAPAARSTASRSKVAKKK
jgi:hypothetical protein